MSQVTSTSHCISDLQINTFIPLYCNQLPTLLQNTSPYFSNQLTDMTLYRYTTSSQHFTFHLETASFILFYGDSIRFSLRFELTVELPCTAAMKHACKSCYYSYQRLCHTNEAGGSFCLVSCDIHPLASNVR